MNGYKPLRGVKVLSEEVEGHMFEAYLRGLAKGMALNGGDPRGSDQLFFDSFLREYKLGLKIKETYRDEHANME